MGTFNFRQFSIIDDSASMKVGTDAVLLGAWAEITDAKNILDIGTGSGVLAVMAAQRSRATTKIHAVELLASDAAQALYNFEKSPWPEKLTLFTTSIQHFDPGIKYDSIVCNPPYFSQSLLPPNPQRGKVRHNISLPMDELLEAVGRLLMPSGRFSLILPPKESEQLVHKAASHNLYPHRLTKFFSRRGKPQERSLLMFMFGTNSCIEDSLVLYESGNNWTKEYETLTHDFYLDR